MFKGLKPERKALSLIEVMVGIAILTFALTAILASYANMFILADLARNKTIAVNALRAKIEEVKEENFDNLDLLNATTFDLSGFAVADAKGRIEVSDVAGYSDLKEIRVVACFKSRDRVIGEDTNLNGVLDIASGEDVNNNAVLDSPAELVILISR
jgi:type II secretory pathway pseudopilin PulG